ncbi:YhcN/YlaJ family sporulation lipoprotein [Heyndrickxia camelliae]|uniref:Sporulation protein n=1 Tax=Heyndrickxia camelliae TaxID=1707093 RepID=A0A2N3LQ31_9BACI|nr:YhcN/YlaJ family sporulation lipoprotein [Heyndrickxia camelliae]PKR86782.1 sporulation protein [Heyndrickxia camelliae]
MKKRWKYTLVVFSLLLLLVGCTNQNDNKDSSMALIKTTQPTPMKLSNKNSDSLPAKVKKEVANIKEIYDVAVIEGNKTILVAYKVKHLYRFRMKSIEKRLTKRLKNEYPDEKFVVSSDYKIFLEAVRLREAMDAGKISKDQARKRFNNIVKLKEELT